MSIDQRPGTPSIPEAETQSDCDRLEGSSNDEMSKNKDIQVSFKLSFAIACCIQTNGT